MGMRIALVVLLVVGACRGFEKQDFDIDSDEHGQYSGSVSTNCTCGWTNKLRGRVVGGREAQVNEYPYMAGLAYTHKYGGLEVFCGATIITGHHALTAAHCTYQDDRPMAIIVGEHDLTDAYETRHTKIYKVDEKIEHELYDDDIYVYDIAILVCKTKIQFNMAVGPACLPSRPIPLEKKIVKVTGWGRLQEGGSSSPILMKANLGVIPLKECVPKYRSYNINQVAPTQFCTYAPYVDSCQRDSGGPIVWLDPDTNRYTVVGIVSFGEGCANLDTPGVNTEVSAFLGWIQKHIHRNSPTPVKTCAK